MRSREARKKLSLYQKGTSEREMILERNNSNAYFIIHHSFTCFYASHANGFWLIAQSLNNAKGLGSFGLTPVQSKVIHLKRLASTPLPTMGDGESKVKAAAFFPLKKCASSTKLFHHLLSHFLLVHLMMHCMSPNTTIMSQLRWMLLRMPCSQFVIRVLSAVVGCWH